MSINQNQLEKLLITLLFISLAFLFLSCGSRKVQKTAVKEEIKTEIKATENKDIETNKEIKTVVIEETEEVTIKPIDNEKEIIVDGKTYKNASLTTTKKKINTNINAKENVKDLSVKTATKTGVRNIRTTDRQSERKSNPFLPLLWLLIPAVAFLIYKKINFTI